jgi:putative oxidoreductase
MKKFLFDCGTRDITASVGIFSLRLMIGLMMLIGHGIPKLQEYTSRKDLFYVPDFFPLKYMSPPVSLMASIGAEVGAAILIMIGLATRPAAFCWVLRWWWRHLDSTSRLHGLSNRPPSWMQRSSHCSISFR